MRQIILKYVVNISKEYVRKTLVDIDSEGVSIRKKRTTKRKTYETYGLFDVFHINENNKPKRFGFASQGYIDGFTRNLVYFFVSATNNDRLVNANFYRTAIGNLSRATNALRIDFGTENMYCEERQVLFINNGNSFFYAASTENQRIEACGSRLKKFKLSWWIDIFSDLIKRITFNQDITFITRLLYLVLYRSYKHNGMVLYVFRTFREVRQSSRSVPEILFSVSSTIGLDKKGYFMILIFV